MSRSRRRRLLLGLFLDLVSVALLVTAALRLQRDHTEFLVELATVSLIAAVAGSVLGGTALLGGRRGRVSGLGLAAVVVLTVATLPVGAAVLLLGYASRPNPAAVAAAPLERVVEDAGGRLLCRGGDPGRGPDNTVPESYARYLIPADGDAIRREVLAAAHERHYSSASYQDYEGRSQRYPRLQLSTTERNYCPAGRPVQVPASQRVLQIDVTYSSHYWTDQQRPDA